MTLELRRQPPVLLQILFLNWATHLWVLLLLRWRKAILPRLRGLLPLLSLRIVVLWTQLWGQKLRQMRILFRATLCGLAVILQQGRPPLLQLLLLLLHLLLLLPPPLLLPLRGLVAADLSSSKRHRGRGQCFAAFGPRRCVRRLQLPPHESRPGGPGAL